MGLETGDYVNDFVITNPTASDPVSQGDNQIRLVKKLVKQSLPSVDAPVNAIHTGTSAPSVSPSEGLVWIDTSAGAGNHVIKVYDGAVFLTLPFSVEAAKTVDIDAGAIDGAVIGGTTPAAITGTTLTGNTSLALATGATVTGIDDGTVGTGSPTLIATQNAVKVYVDAQVTAADLDFTDDAATAGLSVDLDSQTFTIAGGSGLTTSGAGQTLTVAGNDATTSAKGVASFDTNHFSVASGAVSIAADSIDDTLIDFGTGASQVSTADVPEQTNLYYTDVRADARIAAADIGDLDDVVITSVINDQVLKYDDVSGKWENVLSDDPDKLSVKGDLLAFNSGVTPNAEERYPMPASSNGKVLTADSTQEFGFEWQDLVDNSAAMALALGG